MNCLENCAIFKYCDIGQILNDCRINKEDRLKIMTIYYSMCARTHNRTLEEWSKDTQERLIC